MSIWVCTVQQADLLITCPIFGSSLNALHAAVP